MQWGRGTKRIRRATQSINRFDPQNQNLFMHIPMAEHNTRKESYYGWPGHFKSTKGAFRMTVYDPNNIGYTTFDNDIGMRTCASTGQYGASNACNYRVSSDALVPGYNSNTKNYITPKKFSVMVWFKMYGWSNSWNHLLGDVKPGDTTTWSANWVIRLQSSGVIRYFCSAASDSISGEVISSSGTIALNKIYLAVLTYDGQTIRGYLNDRLIGEATYTSGIGDSANQGSLEIASASQQLGNILSVNGSIWDFRMYSAALSPAQVRNIYYNHWKLYSKPFAPTYLVGGSAIDLTVTQGFTASDEIGLKFARLRNITHNAALSQSITTNFGLRINVTQSFTTEQSLSRAYLQSLTQTVSLADVVAFTRNKFYSKTVNQSFAAYQDIGTRFGRHVTLVQSFSATDNPQNDLTNIRQSFGVTQVIAFNRMLNQRVTQSFLTEQDPFINSPRRLDISQGFTTSQTASGRNSTNRQSMSQTVTTSQVVAGRNATFRLAISQSFVTGYALYRRDAIIRETISHSVATTQRVNTHYFKRVEQDLNMVDVIDAHRHVYRTFSTETTIDHTFDKQKVINRTISTTLEESSELNRQVIYGRTVDHDLQVQQQITVSMQLSAPQIYLPEISGGPPAFGVPNVPRVGISGIIPIANLVKLDSGTSTILLPVPQLQNTLGEAAEVTVKRSISGKAQAYKKTTGQQRFTYTFWLDMIKALELRDWIINNGSKQITLTNWRGEAWQGNITTDQPQFTYEALRQGQAIEKVTITLSFQGVKLYG